MNNGEAKLINLAFRVRSVGNAETFVESTGGWSKRAVHDIDGKQFLEARFGDVRINFFETALYDGKAEAADFGFLHASFAVPSLAAILENPDWSGKLIWGPSTIRGGFGHRRIAFFEPLPGCRIELMEDIDD
jgi:hypothetical protein